MNDTQIQVMQLGGKGYTGSQRLLLLALGVRGEENPALERSMAGLAYGCGAGRSTCGALTGGCCLLALYAGKGEDAEETSDRLMLMLTELSDWFEDQVGAAYGGIACDRIVGEEGPAAAQARCGDIVVRTYEKAMDILTTHGFDPAGE